MWITGSKMCKLNKIDAVISLEDSPGRGVTSSFIALLISTGLNFKVRSQLIPIIVEELMVVISL